LDNSLTVESAFIARLSCICIIDLSALLEVDKMFSCADAMFAIITKEIIVKALGK
jgi:hypothetical protein